MKHYHFDECDSTQDVLKEQLRKDPLSETILVSCENQLKGRGRGDHEWSAMPGTICFSLSIDAHPVASFTAIEISLLIAKYFETKKRHLRLKWPNDLFTTDGKKAGGILVQSSGNLMLTGAGLNLYSNNPEFGGIYESDFAINKNAWSQDIAEYIVTNRYSEVNSLKHDWESRCVHMKEFVEIEEAGEINEGIFIGLGEYGEALLESSGKLIRLFNGSLKRVISR